MSNDDGLVDELGRLERQRKEIETREIELKKIYSLFVHCMLN